MTDLPLGASVKYVSIALTNTADTLQNWLAGSTDLNTGATRTFSLDNIAQVYLTGYVGTIMYGGSNSQPIAWPQSADFSIPSGRAQQDTYIKTSASTFTVYAIIVFKP